jgi:RHS repeat-associated protein
LPRACARAKIASREKFALYAQAASKKLRQVLGWTRENRLAYDECTTGGQFLSIDPVTTDANNGGSFNRYVYANNSPYKYTDPDGRYSEVAWNAAGTAVTVRIPFAVADPSGVARFTPASVAAQVHSRLSGNVVINCVNVRVNAVGVQVPLNSAAVANGQANVVTVRPALARSQTNEIGGNQISVRGTADAPVVVHELAHSAKAGDQYPGGLSADGKIIPGTVKPTTGNIMGDGKVGANAQTLREMVGAPPPPPQKTSKWD